MIGIDDVIISFAISYFAGSIPSIKALFKNDSLNAKMNDCFNRAVKKFYANEQLRANPPLRYSSLSAFGQYLAQNEKYDDEVKKFLGLLEQEYRSDEICYNYILEKILNDIASDVHELKKATTTKSFEEISSNLRGVDRYLVDDYHINRKETADIVEWIRRQDIVKPEERICMITGEAGCGKTVVLADVLDELERQGISVIGLKADYLFDSNDTDVDKALNLNGTTLIKLIEDSDRNGLTVLIIDQIDALSLSLTFRRKPLAEIQRVVTHLSRCENVRIVLSCREYDFKSERSFYRYNGSHQFIVRNLSRAEVDSVLADFKIGTGGLSDDEYRFLGNPMNLSLYCRLSKESQNGIKASQSSVYDAYWKQILITDAIDKGIVPNHIKAYLEKVVDNMIREQVLSQSATKLNTEYYSEQSYLLSEGYLANSSDGLQIQFRHQTLFDYTYSRLFFESGRTIEDDFKDVHQGLFVRGRLKTLLIYLREVAPEKYIGIIRTIIISNDYRFHLKQLVITLLGSFAHLKPQEEAILCETIIPDKKYSSIFLRTVYAIGPVKALIRYIMSNGGFSNCEWKYAERVLDLVNYIIDQDLKEGISILRQLDVSQLREDRLSSVIRMLCYIPIKNSEVADSLLPIIQTIDKEDGEIVFHHFYANLADTCPIVVSDRIKRYVAAKLSRWDRKKEWQFDISDDLRDMLDALTKSDAHLSLLTGIEVVMMMIEASIIKIDGIEISTSSLYWHYNRSNDSFDFPEQMLDSVLERVELAVENNWKELDNILNEYSHKSIDICHVISITGWLKNLDRYKTAAFDYLCNNLKKSELSSVLEYYQINLFGAVFMMLSQQEQQQLVDIARTVLPEWEKGTRSQPKEYRIQKPNTYSGTTKGKLLSSIPDDYLKEYYNDAWKELEEIKRKGFDISNEAPNKIESHYGWTTMSTDKIEKMSVEDYVKLAEKYNSDNDSDWNRPTRVGLAWSMRDVLKGNPDKGYEVYKKILVNGKADLYYVSAALESLHESGLSEDKIEEIYRLLIHALGEDVNRAQGEVVIDVCRSLDYYIKNHQIAPRVLMDYVIKVAREANDIREVDYADIDYNTGINQVRGCAVDHLVRSVAMEPYSDEIFKSLDDIAENASVATRCAALFQMAVMMNSDKEKTLRLFLHLVYDYDENLLRLPVHSLNPILYLISYNFEALKEYFEQCILKPKCHKVNVVWLFLAVLRKKVGAEELLFKMADASEEGRASLVRETEKYYNPTTNHQLIETILRRYLSYDEENLGRQYDFIFKEYELWPKDALEKYLDLFFDSPVSKHCNHFVFEFLEKYSDKNPHITLLWLLKIYNNKKQDWRVYDSLTEVLLTAYNKILEFDKDDIVLEQAMDMLDEFLKSEDAGLIAQVTREIANV